MLVDPLVTVPNDRLVGDTVTLPEVELDPVPLSATLSGVELLLTVIPQLAERDPVAVGLKTTVAVQFAEAAKVDPQVVEEMEKSPALVPVMAPVPIVTEAVVPFDTVIV